VAIRRIWAFALAISSAAAFKDTSPFFFFSTSPLTNTAFEHTQLTTSSSLDSRIYESLASCPSDTYIIVSQPEVSAKDYSGKLAAPHLRQWLNKTEKQISSTLAIPEVAGDLDAHSISQRLEQACKAEVLRVDASTGTIPNDGNYPRIVRVEFSSLPSQPNDRTLKLAEHDSFLHAVISELGGDKYTVVYTTTPPTPQHIAASQYPIPPTYEMDDPYASVLHMDLKRDVDSHANSNGSNLALFDKYQYLSPGLFMGIMVFLILFSILYVGITAVASLQVSYFAFSKEMGPSAQKKQ